MAVRERFASVAIESYAAMHQRLIDDARKAEADQRPLTARKLRYRASIVARAALAEELNPEPQP